MLATISAARAEGHRAWAAQAAQEVATRRLEEGPRFTEPCNAHPVLRRIIGEIVDSQREEPAGSKGPAVAPASAAQAQTALDAAERMLERAEAETEATATGGGVKRLASNTDEVQEESINPGNGSDWGEDWPGEARGSHMRSREERPRPSRQPQVTKQRRSLGDGAVRTASKSERHAVGRAPKARRR